ncbi:hypothetical protein PBI_JUDY_69 [Arthrobacter phage Judy]|uniref:Uncharacterized protein n=1 Tax=Arthrobacter phage Judy TaxID=2419958 RepID=A0A3G2KGN5_9CAUD|nr:hypothetical protein HOU50_gp69 [Arthrobacter phage Judy]AYN58139.1 hypothetical protein PBI_JUDY_69 [Arthrobacter phage Judy]
MITPVEENLDWIYARWSDLRAALHRGTARPWREPTLTEEQRSRLDAEARIEKLERGAFTLGESPAPIHLDTLDKAIDLTKTMAKLARRVATHLGHHAMLIRTATHRYDDPLLLINYIRNHLDDTDPDIVMDIDEEASKLRASLAHHFSEISDGQLLKADCPWCNQRTLYVRTIGPEHSTQPVIRCESGVCEPDQAGCGSWHRNLPIWPQHEWEWLAKQIDHASTPMQHAG